MPCKSLASFKIDEPCVKQWIEDLNPKSKSYPCYFMKYYGWFGEKRYWKTAEEMLDEYRGSSEDGRITHLFHVVR